RNIPTAPRLARHTIRHMPGPPRGVTRRELLKLSPIAALGAFAVPAWQDRLLRAGLAWSDRASGLLFRTGHPVASRPDREGVRFENVPYNGYDVLEPDIYLSSWALRVSGAVARPGAYRLDEIRAL